MTDDPADLYSVYSWFGADYYVLSLGDVDAKTAIAHAKQLTDRIIAGGGDAFQVTVVDADDNTVFLWEAGKGIVYPTPELLKGAGR